MNDSNAVELIRRSDQRFSARKHLDTFRDEVAKNFCPWHASFVAPRVMGDDFASHLLDGTPMLLARDFKAQVGSMLRPPGKQWFWDRTAHEELNNDRECREYLDWRSRQKMRILMDRRTGAARALNQADEFFAFFGDAVVSVDYNHDRTELRVRTYHTKDCVWAIGDEERPEVLSRREHLTYRQMMARFKLPIDKIHPKAKEAWEKNPDDTIEIRHEVLPADEYDSFNKASLKRSSGQWASVWIDVKNKHVIRETTQPTFRYVVPRWVTLPGSPYAISPATTIALPDSRLLQQQALAILDAAEKAANPPLIATAEAIKGVPQLMAGGITWIDRDYDESKGEALRPLELGKNPGIAGEAPMRTEHQLTRAFYLDVLRMPDTRNSKSTLEVQFLIDEYVRAALPLFAPMQSEYNEALLQEADTLIDMANGYKDFEKPEKLKGERIQYQWDNPLNEMVERQKAQSVAEIAQLAQTVAALEAAAQQAPALKQMNTAKMFREAAIAVNTARWLLDEDAAKDEQQKQEQANAQSAQMMQLKEMAPLIDSGVNAAQVAQQLPQQSQPGYPLLPAPV